VTATAATNVRHPLHCGAEERCDEQRVLDEPVVDLRIRHTATGWGSPSPAARRNVSTRWCGSSSPQPCCCWPLVSPTAS